MQCRIGRGRRPISISLSLSLSKCPTAKAPPGILNKRRERSRFVFLSMNGIRQRVPKAEKCGNSEGGERTTGAKRQPKPEQDARQNNGQTRSLALLSSPRRSTLAVIVTNDDERERNRIWKERGPFLPIKKKEQLDTEQYNHLQSRET